MTLAFWVNLGCSFLQQSEIIEKSLNAAVPVVPIPAEPPSLDHNFCDSSITNSFGGGLGTNLYPLLICNREQWDHFAQTTSSWNQFIQLKADIDFQGLDFSTIEYLNDGLETFTGVFDGDGHKLMNISISTGASSFSLFGKTSGNPVIKNLSIENISITSTTTTGILVREHATGGILTIDNVSIKTVSLSNSGTPGVLLALGELIFSTVSVENFSMPTRGNSAGLVSDLRNHATFQNVIIDGFTQTYACCAFPENIGGLIGISYGLGLGFDPIITIENTHARNLNLGGSSVIYYVGGFIGRAYESDILIRDSTVQGTLFANRVGGFVGDTSQWFSTTAEFSCLRCGADLIFPNVGNGMSGGIVGWLLTPGLIEKSYVRGTMTNWTGLSGGFVGQIDEPTTISDSYAIINMTKTGNSGTLGGLVGGVSSSVLTINRSYFRGVLSFTGGGAPARGCILASNGATTLTLNDVYYDNSICLHNSVSNGAFAGSSGLATASLQTATPFTNWSTLDWIFTTGQNPKLAWEP